MYAVYHPDIYGIALFNTEREAYDFMENMDDEYYDIDDFEVHPVNDRREDPRYTRPSLRGRVNED